MNLHRPLNSSELKRIQEELFYKNISGLTWGSTHNYNLCVDSSVGVEKCADIICEYVESR